MKIVFFITSKKHKEYIESLKAATFFSHAHILIVSDCLKDENVKNYDEVLLFKPDKIIFFMAYPKKEVLKLQEYALENNIPCIGIQEVHQMSLTQSRVNHYFSPLDELFVNSENEKELLSSVGMYCHNIKVTGLSFTDYNEDSLCDTSANKRALLYLSPLNIDDIVSDETFERRKQNIEKTCSMLGQGWTLYIKFHPIDAYCFIDSSIDNNDVEIMTLEREQNIKTIIDSCDLFFNYGNSQTTFDVLSSNKHLCILDENNDFFPEFMKFKHDIPVKLFLSEYCNKKNQLILKTFLSQHLQKDENKLEVLTGLADNINKSNTITRDKEKFSLHLAMLYLLTNQVNKSITLIDKYHKNGIVKNLIISFIHTRNNFTYQLLTTYFRKDILLVYYFGILVKGRSTIQSQERYIPYFFKRKLSPMQLHSYFSIFKKTTIYKKYKIWKRDFYRLLAAYKKPMSFLPRDVHPRFLVFPTTYRCDLSCAMCTCPQQAKAIGELNLDQIAHIFKEFGYNIEHINLTGGEIFLRDDTEEIVKLLMHHGTKKIGVSSNFFAKDKSVFKFLSLMEKFPTIQWSIQTSVDGDEEVHNQVRNNKKAFENTFEALRLLKSYQSKLKFGLSVNTTISPVNIDSVRDIESKLEQIGIPMGYTYAVDSDVYINSDNSKVSNELHGSEYITASKKLSKELFMTRKDLFSLDVYLMLHGFERFSACSFYYGGYFLEPSGKVYKCSVSQDSYIFDGLSEKIPSENKLEKIVTELQSDECKFCMNNCGNSLYSTEFRAFYNSKFIQTRAKIYLDTSKDDLITKTALKHLGLNIYLYSGERLDENDLVLYTKFSSFFENNDDLLNYILIPVGGLSYAL